MDALTTHQLQVERRERVIEPIKCMRSPHTSYRWRGEESHRANQVYALTTHQLQVDRRESHRANQVYALTTHQLQVERRKRVTEPIKCMRSPPHQLQVDRRESHRANQVYALTTHQLQVERRKRVIETIKCLVTPFKRLIHSGTNTSLLRVRDAKLCLVLFLLSK